MSTTADPTADPTAGPTPTFVAADVIQVDVGNPDDMAWCLARLGRRVNGFYLPSGFRVPATLDKLGNWFVKIGGRIELEVSDNG